ncbi:MAG TPA: OmpP1/FadL family transporter [Candidatus Aquabacterium excrementipullorum]|nr:OmpP1/FadL family transporter [Candidatus Aquabacterium excrementipullorum]
MAGASASGYRFGSQSVAGQGNADANAAEANDVSVQFYNPAGLTRIKGKQLQLGGTVVAPHFTYQDTGSTRFTGTSTGGDKPSNIAPDAAFAPNGYFSTQLTNDLTFGVGVFVPYGAKLDYGNTWSGRYALNAIEMESLNINPSIAWKANEHHSFGAGISAEYMKAKLSQSVDVPGSIAALPSSTALALAGQIATAGGNPTLLSAAKDGSARMNGEDWGFGFNLGYLFELDANTRFGLAYRSQIRHKLTGDATWDFSGVTSDPIVNRFVQAASGKANSDARVRLTTPETVSANAFHQINDTWAVMGDVTWTRNSRLKDLHIEFPGTSEGDEVIRQQWRDTVRVSVGANYRINQRFLVRAGYAYDQSPVRSAELTHPALPDGDRNWLSLGLNVKVDDKSSIDLAYSYVKLDDVRSNYKNACYPTSTTCTGNGETTKGLYQTFLQFFGLSYTYRF